jgi:hypothetical protein
MYRKEYCFHHRHLHRRHRHKSRSLWSLQNCMAGSWMHRSLVDTFLLRTECRKKIECWLQTNLQHIADIQRLNLN